MSLPQIHVSPSNSCLPGSEEMSTYVHPRSPDPEPSKPKRLRLRHRLPTGPSASGSSLPVPRESKGRRSQRMECEGICERLLLQTQPTSCAIITGSQKPASARQHNLSAGEEPIMQVLSGSRQTRHGVGRVQYQPSPAAEPHIFTECVRPNVMKRPPLKHLHRVTKIILFIRCLFQGMLIPNSLQRDSHE